MVDGAARFFAGAVIIMFISGCTLHPAGEREERAAAFAAGKNYRQQVEARVLPTLPDQPTADDLVRYAMFSSAELESRYWQWVAAVEQIPQDATQATTLNVSLGTAITRGQTSSSMTTLGLANDPMTDIKWPGKLDAAARIDLENARAAGLRFRKAQFELRSRVLSAYEDYGATTEQLRLEKQNQQLLQTTASATESASRAGSASQSDLLLAQNELELSRNEIEKLDAQLTVHRAALNALLCRSANEPIALPPGQRQIAPLTFDDAQLLSCIALRNPELAALAAETRARQQGVRLAKLQYVPDFNLSATSDLAGITQSLLAQATIPLLRYEALNSAIAQAEANFKAGQALRRQTQRDLAAQVIGDLSTVRDADRQIALFQRTILPRARQAVELTRASYESGRARLTDLLETQRMLITLQRLVVDLTTLRSKRVAELEAIAQAPITSTGASLER